MWSLILLGSMWRGIWGLGLGHGIQVIKFGFLVIGLAMAIAEKLYYRSVGKFS